MPDDAELIAAAKRGDRKAFSELVVKYQRRVYLAALHVTGNHSDADDVAQETFVKAYRHIAGFDGRSDIFTWLYRIAINTAKNALVSRDRSPISYEINLNSDEDAPDVASRLRDPDTPEGLALTEEIRATVNAAIDALPEDLRTAIVLRELDGMSYEEISVAMDCPVGTVRSRIFRARESIDRRLREVFDGGLGRAEEQV